MIALIPALASTVGSLSGVETAPAPLGRPGGASATASQVSFTEMFEQVANGAIDTLKTGEASAIAGLKGGAPVQQVVEQVLSAERTLQTTIALRDKAVGAYQEISRMAI